MADFQPSAELRSKPEALSILPGERVCVSHPSRSGFYSPLALPHYYKRDSQHFLRHLSDPEKQKSLNKLESDYRNIILDYFHKENSLNQKIDQFVNQAFFLDISVPQILEIHMELMDTFAKQLKLEGRSEEILLDYRLTLIDVIAHLCEMYRCSVPKEP